MKFNFRKVKAIPPAERGAHRISDKVAEVMEQFERMNVGSVLKVSFDMKADTNKCVSRFKSAASHLEPMTFRVAQRRNDVYVERLT